jgi:hypothetical protein
MILQKNVNLGAKRLENAYRRVIAGRSLPKGFTTTPGTPPFFGESKRIYVRMSSKRVSGHKRQLLF